MKRLLEDTRDLILNTFRKAAQDDIMTLGAAIAFYTIFSIAPLFILVVAVAGFFISEDMIQIQLREYLEEFAGPEITENLLQFISGISYSPGSVWTTILASAIIIFGATTVINQLKVALNRIWNIRQVKINTLWQFLLNRLLSFGMILIFSMLLLTSLLAEGIIGLVSTVFVELLPGVPLDFYQLLTRLTTIGFAVIFFTLIFKILPDVHARWKDVVVGAAVTTLLFMLGMYLIGLYLSTGGMQAAYRAAGALVVFVIWVYYNVLTILLGAVFTQVYTEMFGGRILPYKFVELKEMTGLSRWKEKREKSRRESNG